MSFGESAEIYQTARQAYPEAVFDHIKKQSDPTSKKILLDLGCGTGIATRLLKPLGFSKITGCDVDHDMLTEAQKHNIDIILKNAIDYVCSSADNMPFANESFDVITSFGAFHWFCDTKSIAEIKRVLKNDALFFIINKNDTSDFRQQIIGIASQHVTVKQASQKEYYFPEEILTHHEFNLVKKINIETTEYYDLTQVIGLAQSMRFWQHIPFEIKPSIIQALQDYFSLQLVDGYYPRSLKISVVQGSK